MSSIIHISFKKSISLMMLCLHVLGAFSSSIAFGAHSQCVEGEDWSRVCELPLHPSPVCSLTKMGSFLCKDSIQCRLDASCDGDVPIGSYFIYPQDGVAYKLSLIHI